MTSSRPYLIRALYEWIVDNQCTPYLLVNADYPRVRVPAGYAADGQVVLNVSPSAVREWQPGADAISFEARFGGVSQSLHVPYEAVMAIYARENGQGMVFEVEAEASGGGDDGPDDTPPAAPRDRSSRPSLKVVK